MTKIPAHSKAVEIGSTLTAAQEWFTRTFIDIFRQVRWSFLPPLMVYFAAGISGLTAIVGTFFVKEYLGFGRVSCRAHFLGGAAVGVENATWPPG